VSGCSHSRQEIIPSTTVDAHTRLAQYVNPNGSVCDDSNTCWIIPCDLCSVPIPVLYEAYYAGSGGGGGDIPPPPPTDPVDQISVPNASSTGRLASPGDSVPCVTNTGAFTTGCGGVPGDTGQGIGVFYDVSQTCYWNFASLASICFAAANSPPNMQPGSDLTITYCYDPKKLKTQHHFDVPDAANGSETFDTYVDVNGVIGSGFSVIPAHATLSFVPWGLPPEKPGLQNSTSHVQIFANESIPSMPLVKVPIYVGFARRTETDSICTMSF